MDHSEAMGLAQRTGDLARDPQRSAGREVPVILEGLPQRPAVDVLHDHEVGLFGDVLDAPVVVDLHRVVVGQPGAGRGLEQESLLELRILVALDVPRVEHLEGHRAPEGHLLGEIDAAHAAAGDEAVDPVFAGHEHAQQERVAGRFGGRRGGGFGAFGRILRSWAGVIEVSPWHGPLPTASVARAHARSAKAPSAPRQARGAARGAVRLGLGEEMLEAGLVALGRGSGTGHRNPRPAGGGRLAPAPGGASAPRGA